ncbi:Solitary outer membrane autotransporter beta-barrel domain [Vibrio aphrogenes]|uniref:Solitary outer membrane autotransporter beta-barrel domain n=1 Tax=Vibrio aphrogenes TaxID=1891186 RepID=UPI000B354533|nr:Solitary outer membrane autotransporter beta-barrel domain [Vibrio aphrogenes]
MAYPITTNVAVSVLVFLASFSSYAAKKGTSRAQESISTSIVLTDSDAISFGIQDFNPSSFHFLEEGDLGDETSLDLRNRVSVLTLPYSWLLDSPSPYFQHEFSVRGGYVHFSNDVSLEDRPDLPADNDENEVFDAFFQYRLIFNITDTWNIKYGLGNHLMYFKNSHSYNSTESQQLQSQLDGYIYNVSSRAYIAEPNLELNYELYRKWGYWKYTSSINYFYGKIWEQSREYEFGNPKGWYMVNGLKANYNLVNWGGYIPSAYASFKRIDLSGDPVQSLGTDNYYEFSVGLLLTPPIFRDYIDNIGIGINMNYGSALKGGSLMLFFNE